MPPAIETDQLTKDFAVGFWRKRPYRAVDRLTLHVDSGEVFGFLGPNGAGKTTTLKLLMQLLYPTAGEARILGRPVGDLDVRRRIGYLPGEPVLLRLPDRRGTARLLRRPLRPVRRGTPAACRRRCSTRSGSAPSAACSCASSRRAWCSVWASPRPCVNRPEVVFLDEPMSGLDPLGRRDIRALILRLREQGTTVFFSSHILSDAEALCSRVGILAGGRLAAVGPALRPRGVRVARLRARRDQPRARGARGALRARATRVTALDEGRWVIELAKDAPREPLVGELAAAGAAPRVAEPPARDARGPLRRAGRRARRPPVSGALP